MKVIFLKLFFFFILLELSQYNTIAETARRNPDGAENNRPCALVAGGSKGIGYAIAEALAKRNFDLVLIARHSDSLNAAKIKLEGKYGIHVDILSYDLAYEESASEISKWCIERDIKLKMLCNVAGFGGTEDYLSLPLDSLRYMVRLNVESAMALSLLLLPLLEKNAPSYILNVASMAGFAPIPVKNMYSATKSAIIFFSYALHYQLKDKNIGVSCLAPEPVFTKPSIIKDTKERLGWIGMKMAVPPSKVGEIAVKKTLKGKKIIVPGTLASRFILFNSCFTKRNSYKILLQCTIKKYKLFGLYFYQNLFN